MDRLFNFDSPLVTGRLAAASLTQRCIRVLCRRLLALARLTCPCAAGSAPFPRWEEERGACHLSDESDISPVRIAGCVPGTAALASFCADRQCPGFRRQR